MTNFQKCAILLATGFGSMFLFIVFGFPLLLPKDETLDKSNETGTVVAKKEFKSYCRFTIATRAGERTVLDVRHSSWSGLPDSLAMIIVGDNVGFNSESEQLSRIVANTQPTLE